MINSFVLKDSKVNIMTFGLLPSPLRNNHYPVFIDHAFALKNIFAMYLCPIFMYVFSFVTSFFFTLTIMILKFIHVLFVVKFTHPGIGRYLGFSVFLLTNSARKNVSKFKSFPWVYTQDCDYRVKSYTHLKFLISDDFIHFFSSQQHINIPVVPYPHQYLML